MLSRSYCNYWRFIKSLTLKAQSSLWVMIGLFGRRKDVHELALSSAVPFQCYIIKQSQQSLRKHLHNLYSKFESRNQFHDDGSTLKASGFYVMLKLNYHLLLVTTWCTSSTTATYSKLFTRHICCCKACQQRLRDATRAERKVVFA